MRQTGVGYRIVEHLGLVRGVTVRSRSVIGNIGGAVQSIFGGNSWEWNTVASAWYAQHLYEHWAFNQDAHLLRGTIYPLVKEICEFWEDRLVEHDDGLLYSPDGWSPEHGPREDGVMYDQQIVWDLFQNYLDCARALDVDREGVAPESGTSPAAIPAATTAKSAPITRVPGPTVRSAGAW